MSDTLTRRARAEVSLARKLSRAEVGQRIWLNSEEAAAHMAMSWDTLKQIVLNEFIPHRRVGARWIIELGELDAHFARSAAETVAAHR